MERVFGLETEYGITVEGAESVDVVAESIALVRSYTEHGALMKWDYAHEDPHRDARGFRARELRQDVDESAYYEIDKNRPLTFQEIKATSCYRTVRVFTTIMPIRNIPPPNAQPCVRSSPIAAVTRDAGLVVNQRELLADKPIKQRRLADIRPADDGHREIHGHCPLELRYPRGSKFLREHFRHARRNRPRPKLLMPLFAGQGNQLAGLIGPARTMPSNRSARCLTCAGAERSMMISSKYRPAVS